MKTTDYYYGNGLARKDYETDRARLEEFTPIESDWKGLFRWVMSCGENINFYNGTDRIEGSISDVWYNHVLTVLIEIAQKSTREYQASFIAGRGTALQSDYFNDLCKKFNRWIGRLDQYLLQQRKDGYTEQNSGIQATLLIKQRLEESRCKDKKQDDLRFTPADNKQAYYDMINAMKDISRKCDQYIGMIEASGNIDGSLSLLFTYIRNYISIIEPFNCMTEKLADFYRKKVLRVKPREAVQDKTYLIIQPAKDIPGFILPEGTIFLAETNDDDTDLLYHTSRKEYITSMKLEEIYSIFLEKDNNHTTGVHKQPIDLTNLSVVTPLFTKKKKCQNFLYGWMTESGMLELNEGIRDVKISFLLTGENASRLGDDDTSLIENGFSIWLSDAEGWNREKHTVKIETINGNRMLVFSFRIDKEAAAPVACTQEIHQTETRYPSVRILMENTTCPYDLATEIHFSAVQISVDVNDVRNFSFYNEQGETDITQPFYPFGIQAEQGTWFMFGYEEIELKHLKEVCLKGKWKKLPPNGYTEIYKAYPSDQPITDQSFHIQTEFRKDEKWHIHPDSSIQLFQKDSIKLKNTMKIQIKFQSNNDSPSHTRLPGKSGNYEYSCDQDGFFRVTLQEPSIGFGVGAYRELFTSAMIYNSRAKIKHQKALPSAPIIPMLENIVLSYKACDIVRLTDMKNASIRLSSITPFSEYGTYSIDECESQSLLPKVKDGYQLYWVFSNATGESCIRIYLDLAFAESNLTIRNQKRTSSPVLTWEYKEGNKWNPLQLSAIVKDETNGFTQTGFIEIELPEIISKTPDGKFRLRTCFQGDINSCLAIQNVWLNCIQVAAINGNGNSLLADTIQKMQEEDERVENISQPLGGFGGKPADILSETSIRQSFRIAHRRRAILPKDYESLLLEEFPEVEKVNSLSFPGDGNSLDVKVVVFCRTEGFPYFMTLAWRLAVMQKYLSAYTSPFIPLEVINPVYRPIDVSCKATLKSGQVDKDKVEYQLAFIIRNYLAPWIRKGTFPQPGHIYSHRELYARIANHEDIRVMKELTIDNKSMEDEEEIYLTMEAPWIIPIPGEINFILLSSTGGIDEGEIGKDFKIG